MLNVLFQFSENTFKPYYYATPDEASEEEGTLGVKGKQAIARKRSANDIDRFFEKQKKKLKIKKKSSSVARSSSGGVAYITSNNDEGADASHLIKIEVYDLNKIKNVAPSEQWKLADVRVKYYADCEEDKHLQSARDVIFNITKLLASKQDCSNYFIDNDKTNKKYSD